VLDYDSDRLAMRLRMRHLGLQVHWAWVPAAIFILAVSWHRRGWWTLLLIAAGLAAAVCLELRARRRKGVDDRTSG
jgi:hypothetical protein